MDVDEDARDVRDLEDAGVDARVDDARVVDARVDDARVDAARDARVVARPVDGVVREDARAEGRWAAMGSGWDFWAEARAASMVPAPIAAATGHSNSPKAASKPSPP
ncbi:hypothetical protein OG589_31915 [Sphaerisporangium sp. NBC_01403]|uniref:hypothetical protein n=1 Tax=Sphaerisporangium sp. NBC_01403 TaxID=2903599 RepID=UPI0032491CB2